MARKARGPKQVEALRHDEAKRPNIPTAEYRSVMDEDDRSPIEVAYERRNRDLDPQLVWRGKDEQDKRDLVVQAPPLYIQEKVHPKVLIDDLMRRSRDAVDGEASPVEGYQPGMDLFSDFNGLPEGANITDFYEHDANWSNRMILGDSLQVMASLAEREGLRGKVQCIYIDPPYGIKFNSNFQWSTTSRDVRDGNVDHITREPEQVKAFRDTWRDGIHSYLSYLRDRFEIARDLLADSGSVFVQIGHENVHRVRAVLDEVFGESCLICEIVVKKKGAQKSTMLDPVNDFILWYGKEPRESGAQKFRTLFEERPLDYEAVDYFSRLELPDGRILNLKKKEDVGTDIDFRLHPRLIQEHFPGGRLLRQWPITNGGWRENQVDPVSFHGMDFHPPRNRCWSHTSRRTTNGLSGMERARAADRLMASGISLDFKRYYDDFPFKNIANWWDGFRGALEQVYVVQTNERLVERCILMATDPGDLVLDPTCGSGTTAYVAEKWGRRWITIDTSRVALALARARVMGARYPYYLLLDSPEGQTKEAELLGREPPGSPTYKDIRQGFTYRRHAYVTSGLIANNAEIDTIWERFQEQLEPLQEQLNATLAESWEEWEIPREAGDSWPAEARALHEQWWERRIARQKEIGASIATKANFEYLYDKPYTDNRKVRVAGSFTVESLSPHRVLGVDEDDELIDGMAEDPTPYDKPKDFASMILENLGTAGVQQAHKEDRISFSSLTPWPGKFIGAVGRYVKGGSGDNGAGGVEKRAGIFIGPEFGTVTRPDLVEAAGEAAEADFDVLIACAFNYEAHTTEFNNLGRIPVLKARMNADLHMADNLKNTGKGNLFVIFGEPDIDILDASGDDDAEPGQVKVRVNGVDVFHPNTGEVRSDGPDGIACWFIDTDYNQESFFVRHAYFLGQNDPYKSLKTTLKAEINEEAWETLHSGISRPFDKPESGRIAVKVINHLGDEVMKVFRVD